ncbi:MAG: fasciclin domain-containing protein [Ramlibacter sp.]|nr:fasciclin domain-containing protein [Ramlibacter sp.]
MKKLLTTLAVTALLSACAGGMQNTSMSAAPMAAEQSVSPVMVGGAPMYSTKDIIDNAVNSKDHTTLVAAVKAAGLVDTLKTAGPFTVFAPTNAAFDALPAGTVPTLLKPENKATLTKVLTYHVVAGRVDAAALGRMIAAGGGRATLKTVSGGMLYATMSGSNVIIADEKGGMATVTIANVYQSNGVIHVVNKVLLPA